MSTTLHCSSLPSFPMNANTTRNLLHHAAYLNREGAAALSANNSLVAFECFRNALGLLLVHVPLANKLLRESPALTKVANSLLLQPQMLRCFLWNESQTLSSDEEDHHIYTKAFVFQPREDEEELALQVPTFLSAILFNLANTVHQESRTMQRCMDRALSFSLELYDMGFDILIQEETCSMDDWSNNISLAILNNMAEVHWTLSDFTGASRVLELQKGLLDIIISSRRPVDFSEEEMEIFFWNTQLLQAPAGAAAA